MKNGHLKYTMKTISLKTSDLDFEYAFYDLSNSVFGNFED